MTFKLKFLVKFKDEIITAEKDIIDQIFWKYFNLQTPLHLLEDLLEDRHAKNEELVNITHALIDLKEAIPKNENAKEI